MRLAITLIIAVSAASDGAAAENAAYLRVHKKWLRLHESPDAQAQLVVDPREHAMWIEDHGNVHDKSAVDLPRGFRWYAFHVTQKGIVERSFPIRLTDPRLDINDELKEEILMIIGVAKNSSQQFSFSASRSGIGFHVGSGSMIGDVTFHLPAASRLNTGIKYKSFLAPQSPRLIKPKETIRKDEVSVRVVRRRTPPIAE
jgi:hypothetical protein